MKIFITNSSSETQKFGEEFARSHLARLKHGIIALYGDLGSGKTTFVQGLANGLGIKRRIISPTFIIVRSYKINGKHLLFELVENYPSENFSTPPRLAGLRSKNKLLELKNFYHIDLYRMETENEIESLGIEEIMSDPANIVAIEWAEKMDGLLPKKRVDVRFEYLDEDKRKISIEKFETRNPSFDFRSGRPEPVEWAKSETISKIK